MLGFFFRHVFTGLATILPVLLTVYLIYWFIVSTETALKELIHLFLPNMPYWPGMGVVAGLLIVFSIGLLMHFYVVRGLFEKAERLFYQTPLIKSIYGALRDFFQYFSASKEKEFQQVVAVDFNGMQIVGFITRNDCTTLPQGIDADDKVLVYLPMSYMIGGYAVLVPRSAVQVIDMSMEDAMRFALTAGVAHSGRR